MGDGVEVELGGGTLFDEAAGGADFHGGMGGFHEVGQHGAVGFAALLEAEAPGLHQTSYAAVEGSLRVMVNI